MKKILIKIIYQVFNNDDIIFSLKNQSEDEESDDSSCDKSKNTHRPSPREAFAAFETGLKYNKSIIIICNINSVFIVQIIFVLCFTNIITNIVLK